MTQRNNRARLRTFVVTGASSGIGLAAVQRLLAEGGSVVGADLTAPPELGERFTFVTADVADEAAVGALFAAVPDRLDGVVHAAGVAGGGPVHLLDKAEWDRVIAVNLSGTFLVAKAALARMIEQPRVDGERGSIVTLASIEGLEGTAGGSAYNASKGGVVLLTKNIALDYGPSGIRANAICPGFIATPMLDNVFRMPGMEGPLRSITEEHSLQRLGRPDEIAAMAAFLVSPDASFVSGQTIAVGRSGRPVCPRPPAYDMMCAGTMPDVYTATVRGHQRLRGIARSIGTTTSRGPWRRTPQRRDGTVRA